jgi:hypothetical protein
LLLQSRFTAYTEEKNASLFWGLHQLRDRYTITIARESSIFILNFHLAHHHPGSLFIHSSCVAWVDFFKLDVDDKVKMSTKTPKVFDGGAAKVSLALKNGAPKLTAKWKQSDAFEVNELTYDYKKSAVTIETTFSQIPSAPGVSVDVNMTKALKAKKEGGTAPAPEFPLEVTYESGDMLSASLACTAPSFSEIEGSCTLYTDGLTVGAGVTVDTASSSAVDYPISLSYGTGPYYGAVEATEKMGTFTLLGSYKPTSELSLAGSYMFPENTKEMYKFAAVYTPEGDKYNTSIKGMLSFTKGFDDDDTKGGKQLNLTYCGDPVKGVSMEAKCQAPLADLAALKLKYGLGLTFG